jgi:hypothetical protein
VLRVEGLSLRLFSLRCSSLKPQFVIGRMWSYNHDGMSREQEWEQYSGFVCDEIFSSGLNGVAGVCAHAEATYWVKVYAAACSESPYSDSEDSGGNVASP